MIILCILLYIVYDPCVSTVLTVYGYPCVGALHPIFGSGIYPILVTPLWTWSVGIIYFYILPEPNFAAISLSFCAQSWP